MRLRSSDQMKLSVIIPCYNEEEGLKNLASKIKPVLRDLSKTYKIELIFVDDGSTDSTNSLLHKYFKNSTILTHEKNKNLGGALKTGFLHASGDYVACFDSDCTYGVDLLKKMLDKFDEDTSIVTVSPYHPKGKIVNVPFYRIFLSRAVSMIYKVLLNSGINTHGAMVRIYKKDVLKNIRVKSNDFLFVTEFLVKAKLRGYNIKEVPADLNVREFGESKLKLFSTIKDHIKLINKILLYKFAGVRV
jgi:dolichol-phosphate mannosyltransferase